MLANRLTVVMLTAALTIVAASAHAQTTLASTIEVYVFPKSGQNAEAQSKAEAECYEWAAKNTGTDPFELSRKVEKETAAARAEAQQKSQQATQGAGVQGAARGAARGALIGEIADDRPGQGAAWGAAAGAMRGRRAARRNQQSAAKEAEQQIQQAKAASAAEGEKFKKAFSVCLEAKEYLVKY